MGDCPGSTKPAVDPAVGNGEHTSSVRKYMYVQARLIPFRVRVAGNTV